MSWLPRDKGWDALRSYPRELCYKKWQYALFAAGCEGKPRVFLHASP